jgi:hypothetical protein
MQLWLDAADTTSITFSSGTNNVTAWRDKSGNGNNATAGVSPTYSSNGVQFDGTTSYLTSALTIPTNTHCLIAVHNPTSTAKNTSLFRFQAPAGYIVFPYYNTYDQGYITGYDGPSLVSGSSTLADNCSAGKINITVANIASTSQVIYNNGVQQSSTTASITSGTSVSLTLGSFLNAGTPIEFYQGTIYETVVFNNALSTAQRQQVEGYLAWKWGLQSNLPSTHAYAKFAP